MWSYVARLGHPLQWNCTESPLKSKAKNICKCGRNIIQQQKVLALPSRWGRTWSELYQPLVIKKKEKEENSNAIKCSLILLKYFCQAQGVLRWYR